MKQNVLLQKHHVSKKHGESLQPSTPEYSKNTTPKILSDKCVTSKTSVSNTCKGGESLLPSGQKSSKKTTPKILSDKCVTSKTSVSNTCKDGESLLPSGQKLQKRSHQKYSVTNVLLLKHQFQRNMVNLYSQVVKKDHTKSTQ